ncbi:MAG: hypothetical protein ACQEXQ_10555 [Bacillota bacterium]
MNRFIDDFVSVLKERNLQLESVELALLQFVSAMYETVIELELQQLVLPSNLFDELMKETLEETVSSIRSLAELIGVHVRRLRHLLDTATINIFMSSSKSASASRRFSTGKRIRSPARQSSAYLYQIPNKHPNFRMFVGNFERN